MINKDIINMFLRMNMQIQSQSQLPSSVLNYIYKMYCIQCEEEYHI